MLAITAAAIAVMAALILAIAKRWTSNRMLQSLTFLAGMGYAVPGTVLALALPHRSPVATGAGAAALGVWRSLPGCGQRGTGCSAGADQSQPRRGRHRPRTQLAAGAAGVHLPLLKGPITVGLLLVFVDTVKELPLTFALRPFDFDTLSVRVYQYASDERLAEALLPALMILILGLVAAMALIPSLEQSSGES